ncbi:MAG: hypothetical protein GY856_30575, partial [bacterium]|nr:hypothetical protein [bacterium]
MKCQLARSAFPAARGASMVCLAAALALQGALAWISHFPEPRVAFGDEVIVYRSGAVRLAAGSPWHPEPIWPPLYPRLLAGILALSRGSVLCIQVIQLLMLVGVALLLRDLTDHLTGSPQAGAVAGWL